MQALHVHVHRMHVLMIGCLYLYRVIKVAKEFQGSVNFAVSDGDDFFPELQAFGFDAATNQPIAGIYDAKGKYAMDKTEKFSVDALKSFVQAYLDDELENFVKSEPVPEPNDDPVTVCLMMHTITVVAIKYMLC